MANDLEQPVLNAAGVEAAQHMKHSSPAGDIVLLAPTTARHTNRSTGLPSNFSLLCPRCGNAKGEHDAG